MSRFRQPDEIYGRLFDAVQSVRLFEDSKTFVDAVPKFDVATILRKYREADPWPPADLRSFVQEHFSLPENHGAGSESAVVEPVRERIERLWDVLSRAADRVEPDSSLIGLPYPYIVPGGRFREIYYWDSYFTMLGLAESGRLNTIENMVDNFAFLIDEVGFVPNGNRTYFCTRSQPPFFVLMVELLAEVRKDSSILQKYLPQLRREYDFWMSGAAELGEKTGEAARVIKIGDVCLNRYWDDRNEPRAESYAEDIALAMQSGRSDNELYRDIRATCETGWDFSSRWFGATCSLASTRTTRILPIDLNALLFRLETVLAACYEENADAEQAKLFESRAMRRKTLLQTLFFDEKSGFFVDLLYPAMEPTGVLSLASAFPLFLKIATPVQAARVASRMHGSFLARGGWLTTTQFTGQQWDRPNGWAPLQWIAFRGLHNYGFAAEANLAAERWVATCLDTYKRTGRLLEKYDVEHTDELATGGEYAVQDGFGWTNAVLLKFINCLFKDDESLMNSRS
jgi:alpha,alpha-trehalase